MKRDIEKLVKQTEAKISVGFSRGLSLQGGMVLNGSGYDTGDAGFIGLVIPIVGSPHIRAALNVND